MRSPAIDRRMFLSDVAAIISLMHVPGLMGSSSSAMASTQSSSGSSPPDAGRFARLRLRSHAMEEMARFYRETLGLPVTPEGGRIFVQTGQTTLEFAQATDQTKPFYHFAFNIPHNKLDAAIAWMQSRAPLIKRGGTDEVVFHFPGWDAHAIYFLDPSGNIVEFIARHTLKNDVPGPFGVADILYASEIGVVAPDVAAAANQLKNACGLADYHGASAEFTAVGDERGLFIVVKTGRRWFSSDRAAEVFEAEASVSQAVRAVDLSLPSSAFVVTFST